MSVSINKAFWTLPCPLVYIFSVVSVVWGRQNGVVAAEEYLVFVSLENMLAGPYPAFQFISNLYLMINTPMPCQHIYPSFARASILWAPWCFFLQELHTVYIYVHCTGWDLLTALSRISGSEPPSVTFIPNLFSFSWVLCYGFSSLHRIHHNCLDASVLNWKPPVFSLPFWRVHCISKWALITCS